MSPDPVREEASTQVVHVSLPADVIFDMDRFSKVQKDVLGRLGCQACCSGWDIRWEVERQFIVDQDLNIQPRRIGQ